jgi:hypothetical protein
MPVKQLQLHFVSKPELSNSLINLSVKLVLIRAKTIVSMKDEMMEKTGFVYLK